jgi:hypothetical protein
VSFFFDLLTISSAVLYNSVSSFAHNRSLQFSTSISRLRESFLVLDAREMAESSANRLESSFFRKALYSFTVSNALSGRENGYMPENKPLTHSTDVPFAQSGSELLLRLDISILYLISIVKVKTHDGKLASSPSVFSQPISVYAPNISSEINHHQSQRLGMQYLIFAGSRGGIGISCRLDLGDLLVERH